jgi:predicted RNase H-like HicB family nuclease
MNLQPGCRISVVPTNSLEQGAFLADTPFVDKLAGYRRDAMKLAVVTELGGKEGFAARIPGFRGLVATGQTRKRAITELNDALVDWVALALQRGIGLPALKRSRERVLSAA